MLQMKRTIKQSQFYSFAILPYRAKMAFSCYTPQISRILRWLITSREDTNYTYDLTPENQLALAHMISIACEKSFYQINSYIDEARNDSSLKEHILTAIKNSPFKNVSDTKVEFGRRLGWYAIARAMKPAVIVETGVDKGMGSALLCSALLRNAEENRPGRYYGTDINPDSGWMLSGKYAEVGEILYGDSIESLKGFSDKIELFINDSDHSAQYEEQEYAIIVDKLEDNAIVLGDNSHVTDKLAQWSMANHRSYMFFQEKPQNHWYPGAGIGISFPQKMSTVGAEAH